MMEHLRRIFAPPVFTQDEDKTRKAKYANAIAIAFLCVAVLYEAVIRMIVGYSGLSIIDALVVAVGLVCMIALALLRRGYVRFTSLLLVLVTWFASNSISATGFGIKDSSYIMNFAIVLMAGLLIGWQGSLIITLISVLAGFGLAFAEDSGWISVPPYPVTSFAQDMAFVFLLNGVLIYLLINGLENALKRSRFHLDESESANRSLSYAQAELAERSAALVNVNTQLENRSTKLRAVAEITRAAAALRSFDELLSVITGTISRQLGYDHVAIFLLDQQKQYAILRSSSTVLDAAEQAENYRLPVGQLGVVSTVAQTGQPRLALDLGGKSPSGDHPPLTQRRSQLALPLKSGDEIFGVLDIQSARPSDFSEDDISTLSILADQVGIALQNALLFEESLRALREANAESLQASRHAWQGYEKAIQIKGYRYDGVKSEPLNEVRTSSEMHHSLLVPVQLRGQTIGRLKLNPSNRSREWTEDEVLMVKATAERVALALEGTRLLEEAQQRATREAFLSEVAAKLSTSFQLDSILRDTVHELGQTLKTATVTFQLVSPYEAGEVGPAKPPGSSDHTDRSGVDDG
jgi:GAF domain-containing protein